MHRFLMTSTVFLMVFNFLMMGAGYWVFVTHGRVYSLALALLHLVLATYVAFIADRRAPLDTIITFSYTES